MTDVEGCVQYPFHPLVRRILSETLEKHVSHFSYRIMEALDVKNAEFSLIFVMKHLIDVSCYLDTI